MAMMVDRIPVKIDKRVKLSKDDKELIHQFYDAGWAIRAIARKFDVSNRAIQFILFPERLEHNKELRRKILENDPQRYYDREKHNEAIKDLRMRKKIENIERLTKVCPICGKIFVIHNGNQIYCNKKCMWKSGNQKKRTNKKL